MSAIVSTDSSQHVRESHVATWAELEQRATCKKRYGRATLTFRRWGQWGELALDDELANAVTAHQEGTASAEEVAWAYVRARVESHSRSFRWDDADLLRLVQLATACSEFPHIEATDFNELSAWLAEAQDADWERLLRTSTLIVQHVGRTMEGVRNLARASFKPLGSRAPLMLELMPSITALTRGLTANAAPLALREIPTLGPPSAPTRSESL